ncbi:MAG: hypothetical protein FJ042_05385 [Candidatus Cloacimonetes bacterium]|nr:hypothetical protein [Candidatus Cloacimonadota bacterium]
MNRNLSLWLILSAIWLNPLVAQDRYLELFQHISDKTRSWENTLFYHSPIFANSDIRVKWFSLSDRRLSYNQDSRRFGIDLGFDQRFGKLEHHILSGYDYVYDSSDLEINLRPYINKTGYYGYGLSYTPLDSLVINTQGRYYFRNEQDRFNKDASFHSDGFYYRLGGRASAQIRSLYASANTNLECKKLEWESHTSKAISSSIVNFSETYQFRTDYSFNQRDDELYVLSPDSIRSQYNYTDTLKRSSHGVNADLIIPVADWMEITLSEQYSQHKVRLANNYFKNNADFMNRSSINAVIYPGGSVRLDGIIRYDLAIKDFSYEVNSRHMENRYVGSFGSWEYAPGDSLRWGYEIDLQRITYPDQENEWDNDLLSQSYRVGIIKYLHKRIRFRNWLVINTKDDIYIDALLSSNNHRMRSVSLIPELGILLGDRLYLSNDYVIRADYTSYDFKAENRSGTLYRQLAGNYSMVFDTFPFIARSSDLVWMYLPYRSGEGKALRLEARFEYQQNEYGNKIEDYYLITNRNTRFTAAINLKHDIHNLYYIIHPKYTWGTWKEYNLLVGCAWQIDHDSIIELSLNPYGDNIKHLTWQISTVINLRF